MSEMVGAGKCARCDACCRPGVEAKQKVAMLEPLEMEVTEAARNARAEARARWKISESHKDEKEEPA